MVELTGLSLSGPDQVMTGDIENLMSQRDAVRSAKLALLRIQAQQSLERTDASRLHVGIV